MLWTIVLIIMAMWALGFIGSVGGSLIHALLVIALIVALFQLFGNRGGRVL